MNNLGKITKVGKFWTKWGKFGQWKKGSNFSGTCSLRSPKYDLSKKKYFEKIPYFFMQNLKKRWGNCWTLNFIFI